jgi:hypothetical protein
MGEHAKVRAVRMSDDLWEFIEQEASRQRISAAQFLREAAIWRLAHHGTSRGELDLDEFLVKFAAAARRSRRAPAVPPVTRGPEPAPPKDRGAVTERTVLPPMRAKDPRVR